MEVTKKHHELYQELGAIVGTEYVSDDLAVLLPYTRDMSPFPPGKPQGVVVRPGSVEEVVELVRLANQTRIPLIPIGGKATLSGVPPGQPGRGIIIDMKRMDKVLEIDEANMAVTVQCGITMGEMVANANKKGWDLTAVAMPTYANTVGGHLSGYVGGGIGNYGFSTGTNTNYLLGIKVVLPDGSVVDTGTGEGSISTYRGHTWARGMQGPDLAGLFLGDGGMFGIKVEATYRMFRLPKFKISGVRCWDNLDHVYKAFNELWETDPFLYMQSFAKMMILAPEIAGLAGAEPAWTLVWLSIGNSEREVELKHEMTEAVCTKHGGREASPALVAFVESLFYECVEMGKMATLGAHGYFEHIICRRDILEALKWSREYFLNLMKKKGILSDLSDFSRVKTFTIMIPVGLGCGTVCITPWFDQNDKKLKKIIYEALLEYLEEGLHRGYVIEGSQGRESRLKAKQWTPGFHNFILSLKKMMDPNNIMNPGIYSM
jgi:glycolate oxidase